MRALPIELLVSGTRWDSNPRAVILSEVTRLYASAFVPGEGVEPPFPVCKTGTLPLS